MKPSQFFDKNLFLISSVESNVNLHNRYLATFRNKLWSILAICLRFVLTICELEGPRTCSWLFMTAYSSSKGFCETFLQKVVYFLPWKVDCMDTKGSSHISLLSSTVSWSWYARRWASAYCSAVPKYDRCWLVRLATTAHDHNRPIQPCNNSGCPIKCHSYITYTTTKCHTRKCHKNVCNSRNSSEENAIIRQTCNILG